MKHYLNLGCGDRFHRAWANVDVRPSDPTIIAADLTAPFPFLDGEFDAVYASHLLEHFSAADGQAFVSECVRVLKPGGVCRIVVPDLEGIARSYLECLDQLVSYTDKDNLKVVNKEGLQMAEANRHWMLLELYDQTTRERSGGEMQRYMADPDIVNKDFVIQRIGAEALPHFEKQKKKSARSRPRFLAMLRRMHPAMLLEWCFAKIYPTGYQALMIGRFRNSGEIHKWMYDRYSLVQLLMAAGLSRVVPRAAHESLIPGWVDFLLDADFDGQPHKPDSLFVEGVKH